MGGGRFRILDERAPLYVFEFSGVLSDAEFRGYLERMVEINERGLHAIVFDATHAGMMPPRQRKMMAEWMQANESLNQQATAGLAFVLPHRMLRGLLTAVLWLSRMPCPHSVVSTREQGIAWCEHALHGRGLGGVHELR